MKRTNILVTAGAALLFAASAYAFSGSGGDHAGCAGDCTQCHTLDKKDAEAVLKKLKDAKNLPPNATVTEIKLAPMGGLWQVELDADGKKGQIYIDFSKRFLVPQIVPLEMIRKAKEYPKADFSKFPLADAVLMGQKGAKKKVAVFTDPDCPFCQKLHEEMKKVVEKRSDIAFYLFLNPLPMHKDAYKKVQAILCERSLALTDAAFSGKPLPAPACSADAVERNIALAKKMEYTSTPTLVRGDGTVTTGALQADRLIDWIDGK